MHVKEAKKMLECIQAGIKAEGTKSDFIEEM